MRTTGSRCPTAQYARHCGRWAQSSPARSPPRIRPAVCCANSRRRRGERTLEHPAPWFVTKPSDRACCSSVQRLRRRDRHRQRGRRARQDRLPDPLARTSYFTLHGDRTARRVPRAVLRARLKPDGVSSATADDRQPGRVVAVSGMLMSIKPSSGRPNLHLAALREEWREIAAERRLRTRNHLATLRRRRDGPGACPLPVPRPYFRGQRARNNARRGSDAPGRAVRRLVWADAAAGRAGYREPPGLMRSRR
jgi:hypothetical protein